MAAPPKFRTVTQGQVGTAKPTVLTQFAIPNGNRYTVYSNGYTQIENSANHTISGAIVPGLITPGRNLSAPSQDDVLAALTKPRYEHPYIDGSVVVVLRSGIGTYTSDVRPTAQALTAMHSFIARANTKTIAGVAPSASIAAYMYTNDAQINRVLTTYGVSLMHRLFSGSMASRVAAMRARASAPSASLPVENAYVLNITNGHVQDAVATLRQLPNVAYASANFRATTLNTRAIPISTATMNAAKAMASRPRPATTMRRSATGIVGTADIPTNFDVAYSGQSMLNAPGVDAVAAYDEIESHFHQLPGTGEIITNVSLGDLDDSNMNTNPNDPCYGFASAYQKATRRTLPPTTVVLGQQRYLTIPSMPLIPTYTADTDGNVNSMGEVCGVDPADGEIDLDFSVMSPLPDNQQRGGAQGSGYTDLMGIAPGAQYRLVVPQNPSPGAADLAGALLGAALQQPAPNVITASIGWGQDSVGFPGRYLEEDPLVRATIASIVAQGIVVCISSGDGLREATNAAVNPSGGTVAINTVTSGGTDLNDDGMSTIPSAVQDTGSIAVGGTTLDDVVAAPSNNPQFAAYKDSLALPETRWDGFGAFASAWGPRVNISAPSDNIVVNSFLGSASLSGGTSASSPEVAAAAAVALQVARLTGKPFTSATALRSFLVANANPVPNVPQVDQAVSVGPQVDVAHTVEALLKQGGITVTPSVSRVAIAQRQPYGRTDFGFTTATDPTSIDASQSAGIFTHTIDAGFALYQPITIAPDWEGLPANAKFQLYISGNPKNVLDTNRWARLSPHDLFTAAGLPLYSSSSRTINLTYQATVGLHTAAEASMALTFLPNQQVLYGMGPAPIVAPVTTGSTISVQYDISNLTKPVVSNPQITVSYPGRTSDQQPGYRPLYQVPLTQATGTVQIPVSALQGDGIYGIAITFKNSLYPGAPDSSTVAYTRVARAGALRPAAPLLSLAGTTTTAPGHYLDVPIGGTIQVAWDVSNVTGATGAIVEISAPGPTGGIGYSPNYNTFNNPNGSIIDHNGVDTGSQYTVQVSGTSGTVSIPASSIGVSQNQTIRVIPMNGSTAVGEAGDESTIATHGIQTADGGSIFGGFSVNPSGTDGILTSEQTFSDPATGGTVIQNSLQAFSLTTNSVGAYIAQVQTPMSLSSVDPYLLNDIFRTRGLGMDPTSDVGYVLSPRAWSPGCAQSCTANPNVFADQLIAVPGVNSYANGLFGAGTPNVMPTPANGQYLSENNGYALTTGTTGTTATPPSLIALGTGNPPQLGTSYNFTNLNGMALKGFSADYGQYAVALASSGITNHLDMLVASTGTETPIPLVGTDPTAFISQSLIDHAGNIVLLTSVGSKNALSIYSPTAPFANTQIPLYGFAPIAITDIGNGWYAAIEIGGPTYTSFTDNNSMSAVELVSSTSPYVHYVIPVSGLDTIISQMSFYVGQGFYSNMVQANGGFKMLYIPGASSNEIAPISLSGLNL